LLIKISEQGVFLSSRSMPRKIYELTSTKTTTSANIKYFHTYLVPTAPSGLNLLLEGTAGNG